MSIAGSDCAQFFSGKLVGRTKIVPKISPNKSLEGYVFAMISCTAIYWFFLADESYDPHVQRRPRTLTHHTGSFQRSSASCTLS